MLEECPDLLIREQTQELLHMGKNRILNYIHTGRPRAMVLDGRYRIRKDGLDKKSRIPVKRFPAQ